MDITLRGQYGPSFLCKLIYFQTGFETMRRLEFVAYLIHGLGCGVHGVVGIGEVFPQERKVFV